MKKKGFTLVELLVVIAIIALLMGILMPALARVRQIAFRMVCGTNLSGIGKAMLIYANDYEDELPRSGGRTSVWSSQIPQWDALNRFNAYGVSAAGEGGQATITSCFYLLVKYAEVTPKSFICKGDSGVTEFKPADYGAGNRDLIELWDFGPYTDESSNPMSHCSYSYHMPFGLYALTTSSEPGMAVAADKNPWMDSPGAEGKAFPGSFNPDGGKEAVQYGNAVTHQEDAQNVLFLDIHVGQEKRPFCGINDDNIYTYWDGGDIRIGAAPVIGSEPMDRLDSLLVQDGGAGSDSSGGGAAPPKGRACFLSDTLAMVNGKNIQISKVTAGQGISKVEEHEGTFVRRDIVLDSGNTISVVEAHCFMTDAGQWVNAPNLTVGMRLKTLTGTVGIKSITTSSYTGKVYNLKIAGSDQYMVGKDSVIVRDF